MVKTFDAKPPYFCRLLANVKIGIVSFYLFASSIHMDLIHVKDLLLEPGIYQPRFFPINVCNLFIVLVFSVQI